MSGSVFLNNLDDFIAPSSACINPTVSAKLAVPAPNPSKPGKVTLMADYSTTDYEDYAKPVVQPDLIKSKAVGSGSQTVATVSLNDCLACSGCVTSAEAVLIAEQSNQKFLSKLQSLPLSNEIIVVQISPNSRASIADFLGLSPIETFVLISAALKSKGVKYVVDSAAGADVYLMEARTEFMRRLQHGRSKEWSIPPTTTANSSTSVNVFPSGGSVSTEQFLASPSVHHSLPIFTSHCPGWVCYAEKTAPQVLPYLSTVKSAQQIIGGIVKSLLLGSNASTIDSLESVSGEMLQLNSLDQLPRTASQVFVVSIQPCFDKKLEASRRDFYHSSGDVMEVDLVLSTSELWEILVSFAQDERSENQTEVPPSSSSAVATMMDVDDSSESTVTSSPLLSQRLQLRKQFQFVLDYMFAQQQRLNETVSGTDALESLFRQGSLQARQLLGASERQAGSGAVAEYLFRYAAQILYGLDLWAEKDLQYKAGRNTDYLELDMTSYLTTSTLGNERPRPLKFARAYGFRNIQSLLLKMKRGQLDVDLIEMMACPSGCNNGGGQLKNFAQMSEQLQSEVSNLRKALPETVAEKNQRVANVEQVYHSLLHFRQPEENPLVQYLYANSRLSSPASDLAISVLHTRFHAVPKLETIAPLAAKW